MLARRFTLICFICMALGMGMSFLIQQGARSANSASGGLAYPCVFESNGKCPAPHLR